MMIKSFVSTGSELHDLSLKTGVSVKSLAGLKYAAEQNGASLGTVEMAIRRTSMAITEAKENTEETSNAFKRLGINVSDLEGLDTEQQFLKIASSIANIPDPMQRSAAAISLFGRSGTDMLPMLSEGADGLKKMMEKGVDFSDWTVDGAKKADDFGDALNDLKTSTSGLFNVIASSITPALEGFVDKLVGLTSGVKDFLKENPALTSALTGIVSSVGGILTIIGVLGLAIPPLLKGFGFVATIATKVSLAFDILAGFIGGIIPALVSVTGLLAGLAMVGFGAFKGVQAKNATDSVNEMDAAVRQAASDFQTGKITLEDYNTSLLNDIEANKRFLEVGQSVHGLSKEKIKAIQEEIKAKQTLYDANQKSIESAVKQQEIDTNIINSVNEIVKAYNYETSEAGKLGLKMEDIYKYLLKTGVSTNDLILAFQKFSNELGNETALASMFGVALQDITKSSEDVTKSIQEQLDAIYEADKAYRQYMSDLQMGMATAAVAGGYPMPEAFLNYGLSESDINLLKSLQDMPTVFSNIMLTLTAIAGVSGSIEQFLAGLSYAGGLEGLIENQKLNYGGDYTPPEYSKGGIVGGSLGQPQLAIVHGGEQVLRADERGGNTIIVQGSVVTESQLGEIALKYAINKGRKDYTTGL
jgi:hypothetical protein